MADKLFNFQEVWRIFSRVFSHILYWVIMLLMIVCPLALWYFISGWFSLLCLITMPVAIAMMWHYCDVAEGE